MNSCQNPHKVFAEVDKYTRKLTWQNTSTEIFKTISKIKIWEEESLTLRFTIVIRTV